MEYKRKNGVRKRKKSTLDWMVWLVEYKRKNGVRKRKKSSWIRRKRKKSSWSRRRMWKRMRAFLQV